MIWTKPEKSENLSFFLSVKSLFIAAIASLAGGMLYAAALPPLNWNFTIFFALIPLFYVPIFFRWHWRMLFGWLWGIGWSVFSCNFLREIHPAVPYMLAPVISLWPAVFALIMGWFAPKIFDREKISSPWNFDFSFGRSLIYLLTAGALFTVIEWTKYYLFVWNDLSVTFWRSPALMQIARFTGRYGISLMIVMINGVLFSLIFYRRRIMPALVLLIYPVASLIYGIWRVNTPIEYRDPVVWKCALIQGNLPQQRRASVSEVFDSIWIYGMLSKPYAGKVDTVIWPECAIPIAYRSDYPLAAGFRNVISNMDTQFLLGTLDYDAENNMTNSALLIQPGGRITGKYDKFHRVPYGEYVPLRSWLPESWVKAFDMGRDLSAGKELRPIEIKPGVVSGTAICYEGVFSYVGNGFARNGANVLAALSNDVWYPESSEPEQHLANAVLRCVETGLPMVRCGNNGGSGVVTPYGSFTRYIGSSAERPELLREQASGIVEVTIERQPQLTWAVKYENAIVYLLLAFLLGEACWIFYVNRKKMPEKI